MTLLDEGLQKLATDTAASITKAQWGTGTTAVTVADTGLETPVAATLITSTSTAAGNGFQTVHEVSSTLGNGSTLTEFELQFTNGDSLNRSVGPGISKTASFTLTTMSGVNFIRGN